MILLVSCGGFAVGLVISFVSEHGCCGFFIINIILRQYILAVAIMVGYSGGGGLWGGTRFLVVIRVLKRDGKEEREMNKQINSLVKRCP